MSFFPLLGMGVVTAILFGILIGAILMLVGGASREQHHLKGGVSITDEPRQSKASFLLGLLIAAVVVALAAVGIVAYFFAASASAIAECRARGLAATIGDDGAAVCVPGEVPPR